MHSPKFLLIMILLMVGDQTFSQSASKQVNQRFQTWTSLNSVYKFSSRWGLLGDVHIRRTNGLRDANFYFARLGARYWLKDNMSVSAGVAHLWAAPGNKDLQTWGQENRTYQEFIYSGRSGRTGIVNRFRNEQRWQKIPVNDAFPGKLRFTNRVRYLISFNIPVFKNPNLPALCLSDELLVQFGKDVVYNTFDQNRFFVGIRQRINKQLSFDFGYMNVYQQRFTGYQYDMNHTLRLFFYLNMGDE